MAIKDELGVNETFATLFNEYQYSEISVELIEMFKEMLVCVYLLPLFGEDILIVGEIVSTEKFTVTLPVFPKVSLTNTVMLLFP